MSFSTL